jgi:hypothetical protein
MKQNAFETLNNTFKVSKTLKAIFAIKLFLLASLVRVRGRVVRFRAKPEIEPHHRLFCERSEQKSLIVRNVYTMKVCKSILATILIFTLNFTQAQVLFIASTDAKQVPLGDIFEVKFTLKNGSGTRFSPPSFADFAVVGGPNRMNSMTMINGVASSSETISYVLQGKKEGNFTLNPASISVKGQTYTSAPLTIEVIKGKRQTFGDSPSNGKDEVILRAELSQKEAYIGQQIVLDYKIYTRVDLSDMRPISEPTFDGFFKLKINDYPQGEQNVTIGGKRYLSRTLGRIALFPQKEGMLGIEPMMAQVGIIKGKVQDPFSDPFFGSVRAENASVQSNVATVNVKPLPPNAPSGFTGGVGEFKVETSISKTEATTDEVLSLRMKVMGNGDVKRWLAPKLAPVEGLEIYDPKTVKEESMENQGEWQTIKEFEYLILPIKAGDFAIKAEFSHFKAGNTEGGYKTDNAVFNLKIAQGKNKIATISSDAVRDIYGLKNTTQFISSFTPFYGSALFGILTLLPFLLLVCVLAYKQYLIKRSKIDVSLLKSQNASKIAQQHLALAREYMEAAKNRAFYDEISKGLFTYASDKFNIPLSEFSKNNVAEKLKSLKINDLHSHRFIAILNKCDLALFAGQNTGGGMKEVYNEALQVIVEIESDLHIIKPPS